MNTPKVRPTASMIRAANQQLVEDIQTLESFAHARGMHVTAHALNRAKNALGWELAGDIEQAGKASFALAER
jgi:hypothetical protein